MKLNSLQFTVYSLQKLVLGFLLFAFCFLLLAAPAKVGAVEVIDPACQSADPANLPQICKDLGSGNPLFGPDGVLTKAIRIISLVVGVAAVIAIILAGIRFTTSMGDPAKVAQARGAVIYAAVGLAVAAVAQIIVAFILSKI